MRRKLTTLLTLLLVAATGAAQGIINPLDVGLGVRAMGLGGAYTALAQGSEALMYNPAGLSRQQWVQADSSYTGAMGLYGVGWLAGAAPSLGAGLAYLSVGDILDPQGSPLPYSQVTLLVGGGVDSGRLPLPVPFPFSVGGALKFSSARMDETSSSGIALDLALQAQFPTQVGELAVGLAVRDLGFGLRVGEEGGGWSTELAGGISLSLPMGLFGALELCSRYTALGLGWQVIEPLEIRSGLQLSGGVFRWALGLGVNWQEFSLDYALLTHPVLGTSHRLGFGVNLGTLLGW